MTVCMFTSNPQLLIMSIFGKASKQDAHHKIMHGKIYKKIKLPIEGTGVVKIKQLTGRP